MVSNIFYKGWKYGTWGSKFIAWFTGGPYSHSEVMFSKMASWQYVQRLLATPEPSNVYEKLLLRSKGQFEHYGSLYAAIMGGHLRLCWSSSLLDKGVRLKLIDVEPQKWTEVKFHMSVEKQHTAIQWCETQSGRKYDVVGVLGFISQRLHIIRPSKNADYCSETTERFDVHFGILKDFLHPNDIPPHPNELYRVVSNL